MKTLLVVLTLNVSLLFSIAAPVGTAFTYQGRLASGGNAANGVYDFAFALYGASSGPGQLGEAVVMSRVGVTNGVFTVSLDFGNVFDGSARWLGVSVKTNGAADYTDLTPRQALTPTPYALMAAGLASSGAVQFTNAANVLAGNGSGLTGLNPANLGPGLIPDANLPTSLSRSNQVWLTSGNHSNSPYPFLGTMERQDLEIGVEGTRTLHITPDKTGHGSPNLLGGQSWTEGDHYGIFIGGGGYLIQRMWPLVPEFHANYVNADLANITGGADNQVYGNFGSIGGGSSNIVKTGAAYSTIGGGTANSIASSNSVIGGGYSNVIETNAYGASIQGGKANVIESNANYASIAGGYNNTIQHDGIYASVGGGFLNNIQSSSLSASIGGGQQNTIQPEANYSTIAGGAANKVACQDASIGGGYQNSIRTNADGSAIAGGMWNSIQTNSVMSMIGGGKYNTIHVNAQYGAIGGGASNMVSGPGAFIGGGGYDASNIKGNTASGVGSVVVGGVGNMASGPYSTVGGGSSSYATNWYATVPGGAWNLAGGSGSFAAGRAAKATNDGAFVWSDDYYPDLFSTNANSVTMRARGGFRFFTSQSTAGVFLAAGSGSWTSMSDRNAKENFEAVDGKEVLEKVASMPVSTWNYKSQEGSVRHMGPMAQDFKAAFGVGETETGISSVDADGVALAAIKGLNQKLEERLQGKEAEIEALRKQVEELKRVVEKLGMTKDQ